MHVSILSRTPNMLRVVWCAARTCYSSLLPAELWSSPPPEDDMLRLVRKVFVSRHLSVAEHCSVTYAVSGVSRTLLAQYSRHRIGVSLSVQSQRHVSPASGKPGGGLNVVIPLSVSSNRDALLEYQGEVLNIQHCYERLLRLGIGKEDARFILPGGAETNLVTTLNLRSLSDIYEKRVLTRGAQWEIKDLVRTMVLLLVDLEPWLAEFFPASPGTGKGTHAP
ncbi:MAG: FAD-dependent thymidylate synthase [Firmicutes bacterium]|nr:FAD-dependent thymidylate synthase [Bacillota bacterium]